jgi:hypothetical protein
MTILLILAALGAAVAFGVVLFNTIRLGTMKNKLTKFITKNNDSMVAVIDKYVDGIYDYDIVIRISDIDKIRDEWNSISKGEFKKLLYCKYDNQHSNVSDGFYLVKDYINKLTNKNVITVR